jgi:hypothetical protein
MSNTCTNIGTIDITAWSELLSDPAVDSLFDKYNFHDGVGPNPPRSIVYLLWMSNRTVLRRGTVILYKFEKEMSIFNALLDNVMSTLSSIYPDCVPVKAMLVKLKPNAATQPVKLTIDLLNKCNRVVIPLISTNVSHHLDDDVHPVSVGNIYNVNVIGKTHTVVNDGDSAHIHLKIDMLPRSYLSNITIREVLINDTNIGDFKL